MGKIINIITATEKGYNVKKVGENMLIDELSQFEDDFPDGVFAVPPASIGEPKVKVRALFKYCDEVGKQPSELTTEELEPFLDWNHEKK